MRATTIKKLELAAQGIAGRLLAEQYGFSPLELATKPFEPLKSFIVWAQKRLSDDVPEEVNLENVCKSTCQVNYLTNEVLYHLRKAKYFKKPSKKPDAAYLDWYLASKPEVSRADAF